MAFSSGSLASFAAAAIIFSKPGSAANVAFAP
jgi:hypothetical protein